MTTSRRRRSRPAGSAASRPEKAAGSPPGAPRPVWLSMVVPLLPLLIVVLAGGTTRWSQAVALLGVGGMLLCAPPRVSAGRTVNFALLALLILAGTAFLPARWFTTPSWREALTDDFELSLPGTLSPQPVLTAESLVLFLAGAAWFYLMLTLRWRAVDRLRAGGIFAAGVVVLGVVFFVLYRLEIAPSFWQNERHYGPFPNRNQSADFLAVGSIIVLACAQLGWRAGRRWEAAVWLSGLALVTVSLFATYSRAGVILLFCECTAYLFLEIIRASRRRAPERARVSPASAGMLGKGARWAALSFSLLLLLLSLFLLFGGGTLERLWPSSVQSTGKALSSDFRRRVQADATRMVVASPWAGQGVGTFSEIFPFYRRQSALAALAIHPESDYLWLAAEMGWGSLLLVVIGLGAVAARVVRSVRSIGMGHDRRLRLAAAVGLAAFALHGLVDVSAHRLGSSLCGTFLLALALREISGGKADAETSPGPLPPPSSASLAGWMVAAFRLAGAVLAGVGVLWLCEAGEVVLVPGQLGVERLREQAVRKNNAGDYAGMEADLTRALTWAPLDADCYFKRAVARLYLREDRELAAADFRRARYLDPFRAYLPMAEMSWWLSVGEETRAISAVGEACRRESGNAGSYVQSALTVAGPNTVFLDELARFSRREPALLVMFLDHAVTPELPRYLADMLAADPGLDRFDDAQKTTFFRAWARSGDRAALLAAMPAHPGWQRPGWRSWANAAAATGALEKACALASEWTPKPALPPPSASPDASREGRAGGPPDAAQPLDPMAALQIYREASAAGNWPDALAALSRATSQPGCPGYFFYLQALASAEVADWKASWEAWNRYFDAAHLDG